MNDLLLAALLVATPEPYRPSSDSQRMATYKEVVEDISESVSGTPAQDLPFSGPKARETTEAALAAIALNESGIRAEVRDCHIKGDQGRSISSFQLMVGPLWGGFSAKEICGAPVLAGKLAIRALAGYRAVPSPQQLFNGYATGWAQKQTQASRSQKSIFDKITDYLGIKVSKIPGRRILNAEGTDEASKPMLVSNNDNSRPWTIPFAPE